MKCPDCDKENSQVAKECEFCGIIFSKYKKKPADYEYSEESGFFNQLFFGVPESTDSVILAVRIVFFMGPEIYFYPASDKLYR